MCEPRIAAARHADRPRGQHVVVLARGEHRAAHQPGEDRHLRHPHGDHDLRDPGAEHRDDPDREQQPGDREHDVHQAHHARSRWRRRSSRRPRRARARSRGRRPPRRRRSAASSARRRRSARTRRGPAGRRRTSGPRTAPGSSCPAAGRGRRPRGSSGAITGAKMATNTKRPIRTKPTSALAVVPQPVPGVPPQRPAAPRAGRFSASASATDI